MASLFMYSCTKLDRPHVLTAAEIEARFFTAKANTPAPVLKVMAALKKQNAIGGFIPSLAVKDGYALWEHSTIEQPKAIPTYNRNGENSDPATTLVFTPIVQQDSNFVNGFFFSKIVGDSVELHLYRANDYDQYPYGSIDSSVVTAEIVALKVMELDHTIFGARKYEIIDTLLFANHPKWNSIKRTVRLKPNTEQAGKFSFYVVCLETPNCKCIRVPGYCTNETHACMNGNCDLCYQCIDVTCTTLALGGGTPGNGNPWPPDPPPPPTGGGGSNPPPGGGNCTGVNNCGILRSLITQGKVPCGGCAGGPVVVIPPEEPPIIIADTILNPCADAILLQNSPSFLDYMQELKDSSNSNREYGYFMFRDATGAFGNTTAGLIQGEANELSLGEILNGFLIDCIAHCHFNTNTDSTRGLSIFSPDDLWSMCQQFNVGNFQNVATFSLALVTNNNTQYLLKIENLTKFRAWASNFTQGSLDSYYRLFEILYNIKNSNSNQINEKNFLQYLKLNNGSGLKLFRGNSNFTHWQPIGLDANDNVINSPCP